MTQEELLQLLHLEMPAWVDLTATIFDGWTAPALIGLARLAYEDRIPLEHEQV